MSAAVFAYLAAVTIGALVGFGVVTSWSVLTVVAVGLILWGAAGILAELNIGGRRVP